MTGLELYSHSLLEDQLWYVAHPVHPTDEEVAAFRVRRDEAYTAERVAGCLLFSDRTFMVPKNDHEVREAIVRDNIANAKVWLAWLTRAFPTITFIAPWIAALDGGGDNDLDPAMRARGIRDCCRTIRRCSGMVHVGGRVSSGMTEEAKVAAQVVDLTFFGRRPPATLEVNP